MKRQYVKKVTLEILKWLGIALFVVFFAIPMAMGGIPPFGHDRAIPMYVDEDLLAFDEIWAAAGLPDAVFPLTPDDLLRASGARAADLKSG